MTLDRLAGIVMRGFKDSDRRLETIQRRFTTQERLLEATQHQFSLLNDHLDSLARAALQEFNAMRTEMATADHLIRLRTDLNERLMSLDASVREIRGDLNELRSLDVELTELRLRIRRLEKKTGIAA